MNAAIKNAALALFWCCRPAGTGTRYPTVMPVTSISLFSVRFRRQVDQVVSVSVCLSVCLSVCKQKLEPNGMRGGVLDSEKSPHAMLSVFVGFLAGVAKKITVKGELPTPCYCRLSLDLSVCRSVNICLTGFKTPMRFRCDSRWDDSPP